MLKGYLLETHQAPFSEQLVQHVVEEKSQQPRDKAEAKAPQKQSTESSRVKRTRQKIDFWDTVWSSIPNNK